MAAAERFRALAIFKSNFEAAVFIGQSARRLVELLGIWDANKENKDEGFWQIKLSEHAYAVSQLFSVPVTFILDKAYVGGMSLDRKDARLLDFMFSGGNANDAILVEIKTPTTKLLAAKYRTNVYPPSAALSGSVVQVNDYCHSLRQNIQNITLPEGVDVELSTFNPPRRVVIIGNYAKELNDPKKKASFELFRASLAGIDVVTFDEFFKKIEHLARLFNLVRTESKPLETKQAPDVPV
jgi:Shedu protein SduA, C-terminal